VLLSGHHGEVDRWRREQALLITASLRPDLLEAATLSTSDRELLRHFGFAIDADRKLE
jgi:tRNA (guanine37-N1)-methyltransferase